MPYMNTSGTRIFDAFDVDHFNVSVVVTEVPGGYVAEIQYANPAGRVIAVGDVKLDTAPSPYSD